MVVVVLAAVCACVWLFSFNYTIWRLYLFLTSFFNLCTLVALFICVRTYLFILFVLSFARCLFLCILSGKVLCLFIIIILLAHFVITFCFAVVKVMLVYFVSFRFVCVERVTLFNTSVLETIFDEHYLCVYVRAKVCFLFYKIFASFLLVKIFIKHFKRRYRALSLQGSRNGLFAMKLWQILLPAQHHYFTSQFGSFWERKIMPKLLCLHCMYLASFFLYLLLLVK